MSISCTPAQLGVAKARAISLLQSSLFELSTSAGIDIQNIPSQLLEPRDDVDDHLIYQAIQHQIIALSQLEE